MLKQYKTIAIHLGLFLVTLLTTSLAGADFGLFATADYVDVVGKENIFWFDYALTGLWFSLPFLLTLTVHEFGHYFVAKYHKLKVTLPYYIPMYIPGMINIGTFGALIRLKSRNQSKHQFFDVGIAGPLAGFVVAVGILFYGFTHLPPYQEITKIHKEYAPHIEAHGAAYYEPAIKELTEKAQAEEGALLFGIGDNLFFWLMKNYVADNPDDVPNNFEMMHYPFLMAGYLALFFTALNLLPIGQLDGGHVVYGLVGKKYHDRISEVIFTAFVLWAGLGFITLDDTYDALLMRVILYGAFLVFMFLKVFDDRMTAIAVALGVLTFQVGASILSPGIEGYNGWLVYAVLLSRVLGVKHPQALVEEPMDTKRIVLGWIALIVFVLCFSPTPFIMEVIEPV